MPSTVPGSVLRFGDFELDCDCFELRRNSQRLRVERKPLELLILLASAEGRLVTRTEIAERLWSSEVFVDTEHGINTAIRKLRYLLRDDPDNPRFIQTVTGMGYRFIAPCKVEVRNGEAGPGSSIPDTAPVLESFSPVPLRKVRFRRPWLIVAAIVLASVATIWFRARPLPQLYVSGYKQITHDGQQKFLAGTDGTSLYYNQLFSSTPIKEVGLEGGDSVDVPINLPHPIVFDVARDGSSILVGSDDGKDVGLWRMQIPGGALRHVIGGKEILGSALISLSPDDKSLALIMLQGDVYVLRDGATKLRKVTQPPSKISGTVGDDVTWSPDGHRLRFTWNHQFWEVAVDGSGLHPILPRWRTTAWQCCGRWTPDGNFFVFLLRDTFSNPGSSFGQLWALDERGRSLGSSLRQPVQLTSGPLRWATPVLSKDGQTIFARGVVLRGELVRYDARLKEFQPMLGGISAEGLDYSPDGKSIIYVTFPEGVLWKANRDGTGPVQLTRPPLYPLNPHWSPDGSKVLFFDNGFGSLSKAYTVSAQGGEAHPILPNDPRGEQSDPNWSPDGTKIAYANGGAHSDPGISIQILDLASNKVTKVPGSDGLWSPRWSPSGRFIAALTSTWSLTIFDVEKQRWSIADNSGVCAYPTWSRDGKSLYFLKLYGNQGLYRYDLSRGTQQRLIDLTKFRFTGAADLWMGLDPQDTPIMIRDTGTDDFYALTLGKK